MEEGGRGDLLTVTGWPGDTGRGGWRGGDRRGGEGRGLTGSMGQKMALTIEASARLSGPRSANSFFPSSVSGRAWEWWRALVGRERGRVEGEEGRGELLRQGGESQKRAGGGRGGGGGDQGRVAVWERARWRGQSPPNWPPSTSSRFFPSINNPCPCRDPPGSQPAHLPPSSRYARTFAPSPVTEFPFAQYSTPTSALMLDAQTSASPLEQGNGGVKSSYRQQRNMYFVQTHPPKRPKTACNVKTGIIVAANIEQTCQPSSTAELRGHELQRRKGVSRGGMSPTVAVHGDLETLAEAAGLALVPPRYVHHAPTAFLQFPTPFLPFPPRPSTDSSPQTLHWYSRLRRMERLKKPRQPSQDCTP